MRWTEKIAKLADPAAYRSAWRGLRRVIHPQPVRKFLRHIDQPALTALGARHAPTQQPGNNWTKFIDAARWLPSNIRRAQDLGLDRATLGQRILDLGSGAGYFLLVCKHLGHPDIMGLDVPEPAFYGEVFAQLGLKRIVAHIQAYESLPDALLAGGKFDLITAFATAFHGHRSPTPWGPAEWDFLLNDLRDRFLAPGGRVYFDLNPSRDGTFTTRELREFFLRRGAKIERRSRVMFDPLRA